MRSIGIVAHSVEGGSLCFITACREGQRILGPHLHPEIILSAVPMAWSMPAWDTDDHAGVARFLRRGVEQVAAAGADFYVCPDNTAHIVLEEIATTLPIPGLHIADVVCHAMSVAGYKAAGLLGTRWTMNGPVYRRRLEQNGLKRLVPDEPTQAALHAAIFEELCQGKFSRQTTGLFVGAIDRLRDAGADCVILGCTEIPLIINDENSSLPTLDSTRLLARHAIRVALDDAPVIGSGGWVPVGSGG